MSRLARKRAKYLYGNTPHIDHFVHPSSQDAANQLHAASPLPHVGEGDVSSRMLTTHLSEKDSLVPECT